MVEGKRKGSPTRLTKRDGQGCGWTMGNRRNIETFQIGTGWTISWFPKTATAAPIEICKIGGAISLIIISNIVLSIIYLVYL